MRMSLSCVILRSSTYLQPTSRIAHSCPTELLPHGKQHGSAVASLVVLFLSAAIQGFTALISHSFYRNAYTELEPFLTERARAKGQSLHFEPLSLSHQQRENCTINFVAVFLIECTVQSYPWENYNIPENKSGGPGDSRPVFGIQTLTAHAPTYWTLSNVTSIRVVICSVDRAHTIF